MKVTHEVSNAPGLADETFKKIFKAKATAYVRGSTIIIRWKIYTPKDRKKKGVKK